MPAETEGQPTLGGLLRSAAELAARGIRVAIPAVVVSFDATKATCSAQPLIQEPLKLGGHSADPALADVPVLYPGSARSSVRFPLAKGDTVLLVFLDRASDEWALSLLLSEATAPKEKQPAERRWHDYTDAVAIPVATKAPASRLVATSAMQVQHGTTTLELTASGTVLAHTGTSAEALPLATKADLDSLKTVFDAWVVAPSDGGGALKTALESWTPAGTSVLKGK